MTRVKIDDATFSACGRYRYTLTRRWLLGSGSMLWVLLNPSTATANKDDPTIRRCIRFAQGWGFGGMTLVNLFALRATNPKIMLADDDPIGADNDAVIERAAQTHYMIAAGWGAHGSHMDRAAQVLKLISKHRSIVHCLGLTKAGEPRHPLYIAKDTAPVPIEDTKSQGANVVI